MTLLDGSQVSDRCPLGYMFHPLEEFRRNLAYEFLSMSRGGLDLAVPFTLNRQN